MGIDGNEQVDAIAKLAAQLQPEYIPYVGHLQLISTLKIGADCCQLCQYKQT